MIAEDEDALVCDLAEVYHIYDYHSVPVRLLGTLCSGLGADSRIKMKMSGVKAPSDIIVLSLIADELMDIRWGLFINDKNEKPDHITPRLYVSDEKDDKGTQSYDSVDSFKKAWERLSKR